jgi:hypothetical protein
MGITLIVGIVCYAVGMFVGILAVGICSAADYNQDEEYERKN